jgi:hypothetical protein
MWNLDLKSTHNINAKGGPFEGGNQQELGRQKERVTRG